MRWWRRHGWLIAIAAAYLYVFPYFPKIQSANELPRAYLVKAIADDGTLAIDRGVARWGATADVSPWGGHHYANKAPGASLLVVPVYAAVSAIAGEPSLAATVWLCRVVAGVIPMLLFLALLERFLARWAEPAVVRLVLVAYALGSMAMTYSMLYLAHQLAAVCAGAAWIFALDYASGRRGTRALAVAGFLAGAAVLVEYQAAFALPVIAVHVASRLRARPWREIGRAAGVAAIAAAVPIGALLAYHAACFDSPLRTGYDASQTFASYHQRGFLGITEFRWEAFRGSTIAPDNGLIALAPWWLLAIPGAVVVWRRGERDVAIACGAIAVIYLLFVSSINFWRGGWSVGPRYITVMLPFLLPLVAAAVGAAGRWARGAACGLIAVGAIVYCSAAATFPHWPERFRNPLYEVTFRLLGDGLAAPSAASWLGIDGVAGAIPYFALAGALLGWAIVRAAGARGLAIAAGVAIAVVGSYAWLPRTPDADGIYQRGVRPAVIDAT